MQAEADGIAGGSFNLTIYAFVYFPAYTWEVLCLSHSIIAALSGCRSKQQWQSRLELMDLVVSDAM